MSDRYEYSAALVQDDGSFKLVGVTHSEDERVDALAHVLDHYYAWKRDHLNTVIVRRPLSPWGVADAPAKP